MDDYTFSLIEGTVNAMLTGGEEEAPSQQELIDHYLDQVKKPERSELSIDVDDFTFSIIERSVDAAIRGGEYSGPTEEEFRDAYLDTVEKPRREELSVQLDDFLFGIVEPTLSLTAGISKCPPTRNSKTRSTRLASFPWITISRAT